MRSTWKGTISFGLVNVPIKLYAATEDKAVHFNMLHASDNSRIEYKKFCAEEQVEVDNDEIVRGYEYAKGNYVTVTDIDLEQVPVTSTRSIQISGFVDPGEVDAIYFQKPYYLEPQDGAAKAYSLFREAMTRVGKIAIGRLTLRERERVVAIRPHDNVLMLETLLYPDEIRSSSELEGLDGAVASDGEVSLAINLIEALSTAFDPAAYQDEYRIAVLDLINKKIAGQPIETPADTQPKDQVVDLMEALRASVSMAQASAAAA